LLGSANVSFALKQAGSYSYHKKTGILTNMKNITISLVVIIVLGAVALILYDTLTRGDAAEASIKSFEECEAAGNPIMESYPRQCRTKDGRLFVEDITGQAPQQGNTVGSGCAIAGCSGQLCVEADEADDIITTCEFRPEYACYNNATCERQTDGGCGWIETPTLLACLEAARGSEPEQIQ
jgi:hypothetical protein